MTIVAMPDGTRVDFGDLPPDQIRDLIRKKFSDAVTATVDPAKVASGPVKTTENTGTTDLLKSVGSGLVTGTEALAGLPGDLTSLAHEGGGWAGRKIAETIRGTPAQGTGRGGSRTPSVTLRSPDLPRLSNPVPLWTTADVSAANKAVTGFTPYEPTTTAGKFARTAAEFVPGAIAFGGGKTAVDVLGNVAKYGVAPGLASEGAGQLFKGTPIEPWARVVAPIATGIGISAAERALAPSVPSGMPGRNDVALAADRLGVTLPRAAASDNLIIQRIAPPVSFVPIGGGSLRKAGEKAVRQVGDKAAEIATGYASGARPLTSAEAGLTARSALETYIGPTTKAKVTKAYNVVDGLVDPAVTTPLSRTAVVATDILKRRSAASLAGPGGAVKVIEDAASRPGGLTYEGLKNLRTYVGEMLDNTNPRNLLPADTSQAELKLIYGALTDDLRNAVKAAGGTRALAAFDRANRYNALVMKRRENLVRLLGAKNDEGVFDRLIRAAGSASTADLKLLGEARKAIPPDEWNDIVSGVIGRMGYAGAPSGTAIGPASFGGDFSPQRFTSAFMKMPAKAREVLFASAGKQDLARALEDINMVTTRFTRLQRFANPSGTAQNIAGMAQIGGGGGALIGSVDPLTFVGSVLGTKALATYLSRPYSARAIARWGRAYNAYVAKPSPTTSAAMNAAYRAVMALQGATVPTRTGEPAASAQ